VSPENELVEVTTQTSGRARPRSAS